MAKIIINVELKSEAAQTSLKELQTSVETIVNSLQNVKPNKDLTAQINALTRYYNALAKAAKSATAAEEKATRTKKKYTKAVKDSTGEIDRHKQSIASMLPQILKWQLAMTAVMKPLRLLQDALTSINETLVETEDAVISIGRVLDEELGNTEISNELYDIAQRYGQAFENVSEIAQNFARTGLDWNETLAATEAAVLALNVAELDATDASDGLISIMVQFGKDATDLIAIIDELNKVADGYAVTTQKLLKGLQRTGSSAVNANLTLEDTIGILTGLSEATNRSGENLGTAVNSLIQYSTKAKALDIFAELSEDAANTVNAYRMGSADILDVWSEVAAVIKNADERQSALLTTLSESADIQDLSQELHDELGDIFEQTQDVYGTANTFRKNYFIALLENIDTIMEARETAQNADGYSQKENLKYLDTYTAKVERLEAKWKEIANDEQGLLKIKKDLADMGYITLNLIEWTGGLQTTLLAVSTITGSLFGGKILAGINTAGKGIASFFTSIKTGAISANAALGGIGLVLTSISIVVGIIDEKAERAIQKHIDLSQEAKNTANKLLDIADRYEQAGGDVETLNGLQEELNKLIGEQANGIDLVNGKLDDEIKKLQNISQLELQGALNEAKSAAMKDTRVTGAKNVLPINGTLNDQGIKTEVYWADKFSLAAVAPRYMISHKFETMEELVAQYEAVKRYKTILAASDNMGQEYKALVKWLEAFEEVIINYVDIQDQIADLNKKTEEAESETNQWLDPLSKVKDEYKDIVDAINEAIDAQEQEAELAERQLDIEKARLEVAKARAEAIINALNAEKDARSEASEQRQNALVEALRKQQTAAEGQAEALEKQLEHERALKALRDAENDRSVRVYNAKTGRFEMMADASAVESARERVDAAQSASYIDPYSAIIAKLESGQSLTEQEKKLIAPIAAQVDSELAESNRQTEAWDYVLDRIENGATPSDAKRDLEEYLVDAYGGAIPDWGAEYFDIINSALRGVRLENDEGYQDALEKVTEATNAFNEALNSQYVNKITSLLSSDKAVKLGEVYELIEEWLGQLKDTSEVPPELTAILAAIDSTTGEQLSESITGLDGEIKALSEAITDLGNYIAALSPTGKPTYDNGGVLHGIGGIKATHGNEIVLPPDITSKILNPTSNAQFKAFADTLGLMFGVGSSITNPSPRSNLTTQYDNSRSYVVNGVPIPEQTAKQYTIAELFSAIGFSN